MYFTVKTLTKLLTFDFCGKSSFKSYRTGLPKTKSSKVGTAMLFQNNVHLYGKSQIKKKCCKYFILLIRNNMLHNAFRGKEKNRNFMFTLN